MTRHDTSLTSTKGPNIYRPFNVSMNGGAVSILPQYLYGTPTVSTLMNVAYGNVTYTSDYVISQVSYLNSREECAEMCAVTRSPQCASTFVVDGSKTPIPLTRDMTCSEYCGNSPLYMLSPQQTCTCLSSAKLSDCPYYYVSQICDNSEEVCWYDDREMSMVNAVYDQTRGEYLKVENRDQNY